MWPISIRKGVHDHTSLIIRERQLNIIMKNHFISVGMHRLENKRKKKE
jgi:hypothetical protein